MAKQVRQADRADPPGTDVLVSIVPGSQLRLGIVEVDHDQPIEPDPGVEVGQEGIAGVGVREVDPRSPGVRGIQAEAEPLVRDPLRGSRLGDVRQLVDIDAEAEPSAGRVLQHDHRAPAPSSIGQGSRSPSASGRRLPTPDSRCDRCGC
jgi:hypothetical protein